MIRSVSWADRYRRSIHITLFFFCIVLLAILFTSTDTVVGGPGPTGSSTGSSSGSHGVTITKAGSRDRPPKWGKQHTSSRLADRLRYLNSSLVPVHPPIRPIFHFCSIKDEKKQPTKKLAFLHVLKTAGTSIRKFFAEYASKCHVGWLEVQCSSPDPSSIGGQTINLTSPNAEGDDETFWQSRNPRRNPCVQKSYVLRSGYFEHLTRPISNRFVRNEIDIMGGHIALGTGTVWTDGKRVDDNVHYASFFRNAVTKYVSGEAFWKPGKTLEELIVETKAKVRRAVQKRQHHNKYALYLLTPEQREDRAGARIAGTAHPPMHADLDGQKEGTGTSPSTEEAVVQVMANLIEYNVVAGITERMSESTKLLGRLVDNGPEAANIFQDEIKANPSKISSSTVMDSLVGDVSFVKDLLECIKYEQQVTDFALALHFRQYASILSSRRML